MQSLDKRITALEAANPTADALTLIRRIVSPGHLDWEITRLRDDDGNEWTRQPGETEQELIDRATKEVKRTQWGVASLIAVPAQVTPC
jgi:hypothetical protein